MILAHTKKMYMYIVLMISCDIPVWHFSNMEINTCIVQCIHTCMIYCLTFFFLEINTCLYKCTCTQNKMYVKCMIYKMYMYCLTFFWHRIWWKSTHLCKMYDIHVYCLTFFWHGNQQIYVHFFLYTMYQGFCSPYFTAKFRPHYQWKIGSIFPKISQIIPKLSYFVYYCPS